MLLFLRNNCSFALLTVDDFGITKTKIHKSPQTKTGLDRNFSDTTPWVLTSEELDGDTRRVTRVTFYPR